MDMENNLIQKKIAEYIKYPERIIFCIDIDAEMDCPVGHNNEKNRGLSRLTIIKYALKNFLHYKSKLNQGHQFAIVTIDDTSAKIRQAFTSDIEHLSQHIEQLEPLSPWQFQEGPSIQKGLNLEHLFRILGQCFLSETNNMNEEVGRKNQNNQPPQPQQVKYITRAILITGRSYALPELTKQQQHYDERIQQLLCEDLFVLDVLYFHQNSGGGAQQQEDLVMSLEDDHGNLTTHKEEEDEEGVIEVMDDSQQQTRMSSATTRQEENKMQEIWEMLTTLCDQHPSALFHKKEYYLECSSLATFALYMTLLMAHAYQRDTQYIVEEKMTGSISSVR